MFVGGWWVVGFWCCLVGFVGFGSGYEVGSSNSS